MSREPRMQHGPGWCCLRDPAASCAIRPWLSGLIVRPALHRALPQHEGLAAMLALAGSAGQGLRRRWTPSGRVA